MGEAPPVGSVSAFRSANGQPAVREAKFIIVLTRPGHRALVQSNGRGRDLWRMRASRDPKVPHPSMVCSTRKTLVPCASVRRRH